MSRKSDRNRPAPTPRPVMLVQCAKCGRQVIETERTLIIDIRDLDGTGGYSIDPVPACRPCARKFRAALPELHRVLAEAFGDEVEEVAEAAEPEPTRPPAPTLWVPGRG